MLLRWQSAVDFTVLAVALYVLLVWGREARALRTFLGVLGLRVGDFAARQADLPVTAWVLDTASLVAVVLLLVVFQLEIRRVLARFDVLDRLLRRPAGLAAARCVPSFRRPSPSPRPTVARSSRLRGVIPSRTG